MSALSAKLKAWLNGTDSYAPGHPVVDEDMRRELLLGDLLDTLATLDGTTTGTGTDLIGVPDGSGHFTASDLSTVLDELWTRAGAVNLASFTDTNNYYAVDEVGPALVALAVAIGGATATARNYTSNTVIADNDTVLTALSKLDVAVGAILAENTDGQIQIPLFSGMKDGGNYTPSISAGGLAAITRATGAAADSWWTDCPLAVRTSASHGRKPTGVKVTYSVATAVPDDVRFELWIVQQNAHGTARTAAVYGGNLDAHYDATHDTPAKRGAITGAPQFHSLTMTVPVPAYLTTGQSLRLRCFVDGDAGATGVVVITDAVLLFAETPNDAA